MKKSELRQLIREEIILESNESVKDIAQVFFSSIQNMDVALGKLGASTSNSTEKKQINSMGKALTTFTKEVAAWYKGVK